MIRVGDVFRAGTVAVEYWTVCGVSEDGAAVELSVTRETKTGKRTPLKRVERLHPADLKTWVHYGRRLERGTGERLRV